MSGGWGHELARGPARPFHSRAAGPARSVRASPFFDVRVRVSDTFGNAYQEESGPANPQLRVKPEVLFEGMNFVNMNLMGGAGTSSGNTGILMPQGSGVSEIEFPDLVFPGWTDKVVY